VQEISTKANKMLDFVKRTAFDIRQRKVLYLTMVRSQLAYGSPVWAPQTVNNIFTVERVQRRVTQIYFVIAIPNRYIIPGKIDHHRHHPYMLLARVFRSSVSLQVHHFQL
jgi:adenine deaminase